MYRKYIPTDNYLSCSQQRKKAEDAPDDNHWCNFLCQKYLPSSSFLKTENDRLNINMCAECNRTYVQVQKYVKNGKITIDEFKEDPSIFTKKNEKLDIEKTMKCVDCKEVKTVDKFDFNRNVCQACRKQQKKERVQKDLDKDFEEIEKVKEDNEKLKIYIKRMSLDKIYEVLKKYKIKRASLDKKHDMIAKILIYFQNLQSPYICRGTCGFKLQEQFSYCKDCAKPNAKKKSVEERNHEFKLNLDEYMENLYEIKPEGEYELNVFCLYAIMEKLKLSLKKYTKPKMIEMINEALKPKREARDNSLLPVKKPELEFNGIIILSRDSDGYINATQMCKVGNKKFNDWSRLDSTQKLIASLEKLLISETYIPVIDIKKGGNEKNLQGSWIHPILATNLAQWISVEFSIKISIWIEEWKQIKNNKDIYNNEIINLLPDFNSQKEKDIKLKLQKELGGEIEVETESGFIDLLTDVEIIEIKNGKNWKAALGQILIYSLDYPTHIKRIHLFDIENDENINNKFKIYNVKVTYEEYNKQIEFLLEDDA